MESPVPLKVWQNTAGPGFVAQNYAKENDKRECKQRVKQDGIGGVSVVYHHAGSPQPSLLPHELRYQTKPGRKTLVFSFRTSSKSFTALSKEGSLK